MSNRGDGIDGAYREEFDPVTREGRIEDDCFAEDALQRAGEKINQPVSMDEIINYVFKRYGLDPAALAEPGTKRNCSEARVMITFPVWHEDRRSPTEHGTGLGGDLSSLNPVVSYLCQRVETNPCLVTELERATEDLARKCKYVKPDRSQSLFGKYGKEATEIWSWFLPTIAPTLSLIVGVLVVDLKNGPDQNKRVDRFVFRLAFGLSLFYLLLVLSTILVQPFTKFAPIELLKKPNPWLGSI